MSGEGPKVVLMPFLRKLTKGFRLLSDRRFRPGLLKGVAATVEHEAALAAYDFRMVIDVGANRGQFSLLAAGLWPEAEILAFEPLPEPCQKLIDVTSGLPKFRAFDAAIGPRRAMLPMNVARRDDSSSLLPITELQERIFPGTGHDRVAEVRMAPLGDFLDDVDMRRPSLLKIDVQGYELQVLEGVGDLLGQVDVVYVEASFMELYGGQPLADEVIEALAAKGFRLCGVWNLSHAADGRPVQADFLFERPLA